MLIPEIQADYMLLFCRVYSYEWVDIQLYSSTFIIN